MIQKYKNEVILLLRRWYRFNEGPASCSENGEFTERGSASSLFIIRN